MAVEGAGVGCGGGAGRERVREESSGSGTSGGTKRNQTLIVGRKLKLPTQETPRKE